MFCALLFLFPKSLVLGNDFSNFALFYYFCFLNCQIQELFGKRENDQLIALSVFVGFCRLKTDKAPFYNRFMEYSNRYIPREYLALKINYCIKRLNELPLVKMYNHQVKGIMQKQVVIGNHKYLLDSPAGQEYYKIKLERDELESNLRIYQTIWDNNFIGTPPKVCEPQKVKRTLFTGNGKPLVMDKAFFDSLQNDANKKHPKYKSNFFNGIYYRSSAERDIAIFYTEMGIPFKYEPAVTIPGLPNPINPDFVFYLKELDNCKFHEHFGMKDSADYIRNTKTKYGNYAAAGLIPEIDIMFTHDKENSPFDIRYLSAKLNIAVYGTLTCHEFDV